MQKTPQQQKDQFESCAMVVVLDAPRGMEFGIDLHSWRIDSNFRGMKLIPPGFHFISYQIPSTTQSSTTTPGMIKYGFIHEFGLCELSVLRYDSLSEQLQFVSDKDEVQRIRDNRYQLDRFMAPFPSSAHLPSLDQSELEIIEGKNKQWNLLISHFNSTCVSQLFQGDYCIFDSLGSINWTRIDLKRSFPTFSSPDSSDAIDRSYGELVTKYSIDKSWLLRERIAKSPQDRAQLLSEMQASFILFVILFNFEAFEQWKRILHLVTHSREFIINASENTTPVQDLQFLVEFVRVLRVQMKVVAAISEEFFQEVVCNDSFFADCMFELVSSAFQLFELELCEIQTANRFSDPQNELQRALVKLGNVLQREYKWNLFEYALERERISHQEDLEITADY